MSDKATLKAFFETGDIPTEVQYADLIDSNINTDDAADQVVVSQVTSIGGFGEIITFTESVKADKIGQFLTYTQNGDLNFIKDPTVINGEGGGNGMSGSLIYQSGAINRTSDFLLKVDTLTAGHTYELYMLWNAADNKFHGGVSDMNIIQLTALTLGSASVGDGEVTVPFTNPNSSNEDQNQLYYKLATEPTIWTTGVTAVAGATTFPSQTGLTNDLEYDFKAVAEGSGAYSDSVDSNEISATPSSIVPLWRVPFDSANVTLDTGDVITQADDIVGALHATQSVLANKPGFDTASLQEWGNGSLSLTDTWLISIPTNSWFTDSFTFVGKIKPLTDSPAASQYIFAGRKTVPNIGFSISVDANRKLYAAYYSDGNLCAGRTDQEIYSTVPAQIYIAVIVDPLGMRINIDGVDVQLDATDDGDMTGVIMANYAYNDNYGLFVRMLDGLANGSGGVRSREDRIYAGALTESQIQTINAGIG